MDRFIPALIGRLTRGDTDVKWKVIPALIPVVSEIRTPMKTVHG